MSDTANANANSRLETIKESLSAGSQESGISNFVQSLIPKETTNDNSQSRPNVTGDQSSNTKIGRNSESRTDVTGEHSSRGKSGSGDALPNVIIGENDNRNSTPKDGSSRSEAQNSNEKQRIHEKGSEIIERLSKIEMVTPGTGVTDLQTGDRLVRAGGHDVLIMPDGGSLVVKPDGSYQLKTNKPVEVKHNAKTGSTTLDLGKGESITLQDGKISEITRNGRTTMILDEKPRFRHDEWVPGIKPSTGAGGGGGGGRGGETPNIIKEQEMRKRFEK